MTVSTKLDEYLASEVELFKAPGLGCAHVLAAMDKAQNIAAIADPSRHPWGRREKVVTGDESDLTTMTWELAHYGSDGTGHLRCHRLPTSDYPIHWMIRHTPVGHVGNMRFHVE